MYSIHLQSRHYIIRQLHGALGHVKEGLISITKSAFVRMWDLRLKQVTSFRKNDLKLLANSYEDLLDLEVTIILLLCAVSAYR